MSLDFSNLQDKVRFQGDYDFNGKSSPEFYAVSRVLIFVVPMKLDFEACMMQKF